MTTQQDQLDKYFNRLTSGDKDQLEERMSRYRGQLEEQGYEVAIAEGQGGFFAGILVIDREGGRFGFLEADGSVSWIGGALGGIGALGSAVVQSPTGALESTIDGLDNVNVE